jgi:hypothetical protein
MTDNEKLYFIYGCVYSQALELKKTLECYKDWTVKDIIKELVENIK